MTAALGLHDLGLFALTVFVLNATPGADMLCVIGRTLGGGWRAGLAASAGVVLGCAAHTLAAALGLAALLAVTPWAFQVIKWVGAAYLLWLAWGLAREALASAAPARTGPMVAEVRLWRHFLGGLLTNLLNPKVALFVLAFLPQFIGASSAHPTLAFLTLGVGLVLQGALFLVALVLLVARLRGVALPATARRALHGVGALLFVGLALRLARSEA